MRKTVNQLREMIQQEPVVNCFPKLRQHPQPRESDSSRPKGWSPCRGMFQLPRSLAEAAVKGEARQNLGFDQRKLVYRCPAHENRLTQAGGLETWRCTVCCRRARIPAHNRHIFDCDPKYDCMMERETEIMDMARERRGEIISARILRAQTRLMARLGISFRKMESNAILDIKRTDILQ